jgi:hypothetical protein
VPTAPAHSLRINEWLADPLPGDDDWIELFNTASIPVSLGGISLTDNLGDPAKFRVAPLSFIGVGPHAFLRLEADSSPSKGPRHAAFSLSGDGEEIGLFDSRGVPMDRVAFGIQSENVSEGRLPDGAEIIARLSPPTPGRSNTPVTDSDADGLPDQWELAHFGNLSRDGRADFDLDGFTDAQEFAAGTNPLLDTDYLRIEAIRRDQTGVLLVIHAASGRTYAVEYSDHLATPWTPLLEITSPTNGALYVTDPAFSSVSRRFYRVRLK